MNSFTVKSYWKSYNDLPENIQKLANAKFEIWKENPFHPSLHFKCIDSEDNIWSVRINIDYRALAVKEKDSIVWFWIGDHKKYEQLIKSI